MTRIYVDHNATTPLLPEILESWQQFAQADYGNPASIHQWGRRARQAIESARAQVAALVSVPPAYVFFTSGGTESNHWALKGMPKGQLYISPLEHESLLSAAQSSAHTVHHLPLQADGRCDLSALQAPVNGISVMWANNETGAVQDIAAIAACGRALGAWVHTDAVQALGKVPVHFPESGVHLMTLSAHKIGGPMGVGALIVDPSLMPTPLFEGGLQERAARAGTENLWGIIGFGQAAQWMQTHQEAHQRHMAQLRDAFESALQAAVPECQIFSQAQQRLPNTSFLGVAGLDAQMLMMLLDKRGIAVSGGAACGSGSGAISHVLTAMGVTEDVAASAIRLSFGRHNTMAEVELCVREVVAVIVHLQRGGR